ncbi:hypothetical protein V2J60_23625 [Pseudomonas alliivorans]|nr:hypothetical protein [Pseudomonas alliivorans]
MPQMLKCEAYKKHKTTAGHRHPSTLPFNLTGSSTSAIQVLAWYSSNTLDPPPEKTLQQAQDGAYEANDPDWLHVHTGTVSPRMLSSLPPWTTTAKWIVFGQFA